MPIVKASKLVQAENALLPMLVTLSGILTVSKLEQDWNASSPMLVTRSLMVTESKLVHLENASSPLIAYKDDGNVENESNCYPWHMLKGEVQIHKNKKQRSVSLRTHRMNKQYQGRGR